MDIPSIVRAFAYAVIAVGSVLLAILYLQYYRIKRQTTWLARTMVLVFLALAALSIVGIFLIWCRNGQLTCEQPAFMAFTYVLVALAIAVLVSVAEHVLVLVRHNKTMDADEALARNAIAPPATAPAPTTAPAFSALVEKTAEVALDAVVAAEANADVANKALDAARAAAAASAVPAATATVASDVASNAATVAKLSSDVATLASDVAVEVAKITKVKE